jgi:hypothetical protein
VPRPQHRGGSIGADEGLVPGLATCVTRKGGRDGEDAAALIKQEHAAE